MTTEKPRLFTSENALIATDHKPLPMALDLTKREYFAAVAMQGMLANPVPQLVAADYETMASYSVKQADALIKELSK
jgi:hypothetical protein